MPRLFEASKIKPTTYRNWNQRRRRMMIRKVKTIGWPSLLFVVVTWPCFVSPDGVKAQELSADATLRFESEYVFRGDYLDGPSLQPSLDLGYGNAYVGVWTSQGLEEDRGDVSEFDYYGGYTFDVSEVVDLDVGGIVYHFPDATSDSNFDYEPYIGIALDTLLNPSLYGYYVFGEDPDNDFYSLIGSVSHSFDLSPYTVEGLSFDVEAFGGTTEDFGGTRYLYYGASGDFVYTINEVSDVSIGVRATDVDEEEVSRASLWWGTSISFHF